MLRRPALALLLLAAAGCTRGRSRTLSPSGQAFRDLYNTPRRRRPSESGHVYLRALLTQDGPPVPAATARADGVTWEAAGLKLSALPAGASPAAGGREYGVPGGERIYVEVQSSGGRLRLGGVERTYAGLGFLVRARPRSGKVRVRITPAFRPGSSAAYDPVELGIEARTDTLGSGAAIEIVLGDGPLGRALFARDLEAGAPSRRLRLYIERMP